MRAVHEEHSDRSNQKRILNLCFFWLPLSTLHSQAWMSLAPPLVQLPVRLSTPLDALQVMWNRGRAGRGMMMQALPAASPI